jgi:hypothetical protein
MKGQCLCGAVSITAPDLDEMAVCHCGTCRRWGGGPFMTVHAGPGVQVQGKDKVKAYRSSDWAERGFCSECGTHLYYHLLPVDDYILSAGLFAESAGFTFKRQIFVDRKPGNYSFADATEQLTEAQVFAQFS